MKSRKLSFKSNIFFITLFAVLFSTGLLMSQTLSENFDGITPPALPAGWTFCLDVALSNTSCYVSTTTQAYAPSQPNSAIIFNGGAMGSVDVGATVALVSPSVVNGGLLSFYGLSSSSNPVIVGTMSDPADAGTFTEIELIPLTTGTVFSYHEVTIPSSGPTYIAFKHGNTSAYNPMFIDNVVLTGTLPVELSAFTAAFVSDFVTVSWQTSTESDVIGYNIFSSEEDDFSTAQKINTAIIPGHGTTTTPHTYEFTDINADPYYTTYYYWLEAVNFGGTNNIYGSIEFTPVDVDQNGELNIITSKLLPGFPSPAKIGQSVTFNFCLGGLEGTVRPVTLNIYNVLGQLVAEVVNDERVVNNYTVEWNPTNLGRGIYFYQLKTEDYQESKKLMIN
jgi:hypothetical protein